MHGYAVQSGRRWSLGVAAGLSKKSFMLPRIVADSDRDIQPLANPIGSGGSYLTQPDPGVPPGLTNLLRFDGVDDRVTIPYDVSFPTEVFTVAAEIKLIAPGRRAAIIARGEDDNSFNLSWQLYVASTGNLEIMLEDSRDNNFCYPLNNCVPRGSCKIGDLSVADHVWHHVAASRTADGTLSLYIDGESRARCTGTGVPSSNNFQAMSIGSTFGTIGPPPGGVEPPTWFFPGVIDDPAVCNLVLTEAQIADVATLGVNRMRPGWSAIGISTKESARL